MLNSNNKNTKIDNQEEIFDIGSSLKNRRLSLNFTIEQISQDTRIQKAYLQALEDNAFDSLPERTYSLGYLRTYANYLGLSNVEELLIALDSSYNFTTPKYSNIPNPLDNKDLFSPSVIKNETVDYSVKPLVVEKKHKDKDKEIEINQTILLKKIKTSTAQLNIAKTTSKVIDSEANQLNRYRQTYFTKLLLPISIFIVFFILLCVYFFTIYNSAKYIKDSEKKKNTEIEKELFNFTEEETSSDIDTLQNEISSNNKSIFYSNSLHKAENKEKSFLNIKNIKKNDLSNASNLNMATFVFEDNVWVNIHDNATNIVYLDKIFNPKENINIPLDPNLSMHIGNYKGVKIIIDDKILQLKPNNKNSLIIYNLLLDRDYLLQKYGY
jgi:cytoskeletal protein RodZ